MVEIGGLSHEIITIFPFSHNIDSTIFSWALTIPNKDDVSQSAWQAHVAM